MCKRKADSSGVLNLATCRNSLGCFQNPSAQDAPQSSESEPLETGTPVFKLPGNSVGLSLYHVLPSKGVHLPRTSRGQTHSSGPGKPCCVARKRPRQYLPPTSTSPELLALSGPILLLLSNSERKKANKKDTQFKRHSTDFFFTHLN